MYVHTERLSFTPTWHCPDEWVHRRSFYHPEPQGCGNNHTPARYLSSGPGCFGYNLKEAHQHAPACQPRHGGQPGVQLPAKRGRRLYILEGGPRASISFVALDSSPCVHLTSATLEERVAVLLALGCLLRHAFLDIQLALLWVGVSKKVRFRNKDAVRHRMCSTP